MGRCRWLPGMLWVALQAAWGTAWAGQGVGVSDDTYLDLRRHLAAVASPTVLDYGEVPAGASRTLSFFVTNRGDLVNDTLRVSGISSSDAAFTVNSSAFAVPPDDSVRVDVTLTATANRSYRGVLTLITNDALHPQVRVYLGESDRTPPGRFTLVSPANGARTGGSVTLSGGATVDADWGLSHYQLLLDGQVRVDNIKPLDWSVESVSLSSEDSLTSGFHVWKVNAVDYAGNVRTSDDIWSIQVDIDPPAPFSLLAPAAGTSVGAAAPVFAWQAASDVGAGLMKYQLYVDDVIRADNLPPSRVALNDTGDVFDDNLEAGRAKWDLTGGWGIAREQPGSGSYCLTDSPGGAYGNNVSVAATTAGDINLSSPGSAMLTFRQQYAFYPGGDYGLVEISTNGGAAWWELARYSGVQASWTPVSIPLNAYTGSRQVRLRYRLVSDASGTADGWHIDDVKIASTGVELDSGPHTWYVVAVDSVGNQRRSAETLGLRVDHTPPTPFELLAPGPGAWSGATPPTFVWAASADEGMGLQAYRLWIDGKLAVDSISAATTSITPPVALGLTHGEHPWSVTAEDVAGNTRGAVGRTLRVDLLPPAPFHLLAPADGEFTRLPTPALSWQKAVDDGAGTAYYRLWMDSSLVRDGLGDTMVTVQIAEGRHTWHVDAVDSVGNWRQSTESRSLVGEWSPAQPFDLVAPAAGDTVETTTPRFTWHPSVDAGSGIAKYELWVGSTLVLAAIPAADTSVVAPRALAPGPHSWFVKAFDYAGNITSSPVAAFVAMDDVYPPTSRLTAPAPLQVVGGARYVITGTATDRNGSGVDSVYVSVDDGTTWQAATANGDGRWTHAWAWYTAGTYSLRCRAVDRSGNRETAGPGLRVTVDLTRPTVRELSVTPGPARAGQAAVMLTMAASAAGMDSLVTPQVTLRPVAGPPVEVVQTSYAGGIWQGVATIAAGTANGPATFTIAGAMDRAGNLMLTDSTHTVLIDTQPPRWFDLATPADSSWLSERRPALSWHATSDSSSGIAAYQIWVDGQLSAQVPANTSTGRPGADLTPGLHRWTVKAVDLAGNERNADSSRWVRVDLLTPASQITGPAQGDTLGSGGYVIRGTASDGTAGAVGVSGLARVEVDIDGGGWHSVVSSGEAFSSWEYSWTNPTPGTHVLRTRATDAAGNVETPTVVTAVKVVAQPTVSRLAVDPVISGVDTVALSITFQSSELGMNNSVSPSVVLLTARGDTLRVNQVSYSGLTWNGEVAITAAVANGPASCLVSGAADRVGNQVLAYRAAAVLTIDTTPPAADTVLVTPNPARAGTVQISIALREAGSGLEIGRVPGIYFLPSDGVLRPATMGRYDSGTNRWLGTAQIGDDVRDGRALLLASGFRDRAGNVSAAGDTIGAFVIDRTPPVGLRSLAPADSAWTRARVPTFTWSAATDATAGLAEYRLRLGDGVTRPPLSPATIETSSISPLADGAYTWAVTAADAAGNEASTVTRLLRVDATAPVSSLRLPVAGAAIEELPVTISGTAVDSSAGEAGIGVDSVYVSTDGGATWQPAAGSGSGFASWSYTWTGGAVGAHTLRSRAVDRLGNAEVPSAGVTVTVRSRVKGDFTDDGVVDFSDFFQFADVFGTVAPRFDLDGSGGPVDFNDFFIFADSFAGSNRAKLLLLARQRLGLPATTRLTSAYPNPFNSATTITYEVAVPAPVRLRLYSVGGQLVRTLVDGQTGAGQFQVAWDGRDNQGQAVGTGVYLCELRVSGHSDLRRLVLTR